MLVSIDEVNAGNEIVSVAQHQAVQTTEIIGNGHRRIETSARVGRNRTDLLFLGREAVT